MQFQGPNEFLELVRISSRLYIHTVGLSHLYTMTRAARHIPCFTTDPLGSTEANSYNLRFLTQVDHLTFL